MPHHLHGEGVPHVITESQLHLWMVSVARRGLPPAIFSIYSQLPLCAYSHRSLSAVWLQSANSWRASETALGMVIPDLSQPVRVSRTRFARLKNQSHSSGSWRQSSRVEGLTEVKFMSLLHQPLGCSFWGSPKVEKRAQLTLYMQEDISVNISPWNNGLSYNTSLCHRCWPPFKHCSWPGTPNPFR